MRILSGPQVRAEVARGVDFDGGSSTAQQHRALHVSDAAEWDNYEWSWIGSLTEWAIDNPGHPHAVDALALAREHRDQWLRGYRNVLGFVTMVLRRTEAAVPAV